MDWASVISAMTSVALRKESVDRNTFTLPPVLISPKVALRKESVDRNSTGSASIRAYIVALRKESVDRNSWVPCWALYSSVALRKESVDRNFIDFVFVSGNSSRSPQGERG